MKDAPNISNRSKSLSNDFFSLRDAIFDHGASVFDVARAQFAGSNVSVASQEKAKKTKAMKPP